MKNITICLLVFVTLQLNAQIQFEQFSPSSQITTDFGVASYSSIATTDIDNDNDLDVLITGFNNEQNIAELYINDGIGNYTLKTGTPFAKVKYSSVAFADIDNDNDHDLLITGINPLNQKISKLYRNDGIGNYTEVIGTPFDGVSNSSIAFADIDNDDDQDVLITGYNGSNHITKLYKNDGTGNYTEVIETPFDGVYNSSIAFADIDNDNDQDVLITGYSGSNYTSKLYKNDGIGSYTEVTGTPFDGVYLSSIALADIDNDNDLDVLITGYNGSDRISKLYFNDGTGTFTEDTGTVLEGIYESSVAFADVDNDMDQDIFISGYNSYGYKISKLYKNNGLGYFIEDTESVFEGVAKGSMVFADIDNDNDQDIIITGIGDFYRTTNVYINNGVGLFSLAETMQFGGASSSSIAFADVDNDNDQDVLISGYNGTDFNSWLYFNDGTGVYSKAPSFFIGVCYASVAFADIDNDNDQDILISGRNDFENATTNLYRNDGTGVYTEIEGTPLVNVYSSSVAFADIDNDNDQDVLITGNNYNTGVANLYINDGIGNYTEVSETPFDGVYGSSIAFADIDNDNDQDVLITGKNNSNQNISKLYKNDGTGVFSEVLETPFVGAFISSVAFADIDNDNDQDVLITGNSSSYFSSTRLYVNDGDGNYTYVSGTPFNSVSDPSIAFADVDNDNDQDVLITGRNTYKMSKLYSNDGFGNFSLVNETPFEDVSFSSVAFADIDNDNDQDILITGSSNGGNISKLYKNISCLTTYKSVNIESCTLYTVPSGDETYNTIGNYIVMDTIVNYCGSDSILTIDLTVSSNFVETKSVDVCFGASYIYADDTEHSNITINENHVSYLTGQAANGCDSIITENIYVINIPEASVFSNPDFGLCVYDEEIYTVVENENVNTYFWQIPQGWTGNSNTNEILLTCNQESGYIVVSGENECGISEKDSIYIDVVNAVAPQPSVISGPNPACINSNAIYSVINIPNTIYNWSLPLNWSGTGNDAVINVSSGTNGGIITAVPINACGEGTPRTLNVNVSNILPTANFTYTENESEIIFNNLSQNALSYFWEFGDGVHSFVENPSHDYVNSGQYIAKLTVYNSCGDQSKEDLIGLLDLAVDNNQSIAISIFPNPTNGKVIIKGAFIQSIKITNVNGVVIEQISTPNDQIVIDLSDQAKGFYFINVITQKEVLIKRIVLK